MSDALHRARLLQGQVVRLDARRKRQIEKANADYRIDLLGLIAHADPAILEIVQQACDHDRGSPELAADLRNAIWRRSNPPTLRLGDGMLTEADRELDTLPAPNELHSDDLPPPLPYTRSGAHPPDDADEPLPITPRLGDPWGLTPAGATPSSEARG